MNQRRVLFTLQKSTEAQPEINKSPPLTPSFPAPNSQTTQTRNTNLRMHMLSALAALWILSLPFRHFSLSHNFVHLCLRFAEECAAWQDGPRPSSPPSLPSHPIPLTTWLSPGKPARRLKSSSDVLSDMMCVCVCVCFYYTVVTLTTSTGTASFLAHSLGDWTRWDSDE